MKITDKNNYIRKRCGKILHIWEPTYRRNIYYVKAKTEKTFIKIIKEGTGIDLPPHRRSADGRFVVAENDAFGQIGIIWESDDRVSTLAHECLHATLWLMDSVGIHLSSHGWDDSSNVDESFCYLLAFLMQTILNEE